jgi:tetraacyldisaccharide 4'-kinase
LQQEYKEIISGRKAGLGAAFVRLLLAGLSVGYLVIINLRNFLYSKGFLKSHKVKVIVISIGNVTTGGTGKTPVVIWLCNYLKSKNIKTAVLTRGYKTGGQDIYADEPDMIFHNCPQTKVVVNPDRVGGAEFAIKNFACEALIMDDGFQHRRLARNLDIVTVNAAEPFGFNRLLPAGLLREPKRNLARADAVVLTNCDLQGSQEIEKIENQIRKENSGLIIAKTIHKPVSIIFSSGKEMPAEYLAGKKVFAFCGIGSPESFFGTIENLSAGIIGKEIFDDHYQYSRQDLAGIYTRAGQLKAEMIVTTEKDWMKIACLNLNENKNIAYLKIKIHFIEGLEGLTGLIEKTLSGKIAQK